MVDDACHSHGDIEVEFVDGDKGANPSRWRESRVGEYTLQASGLYNISDRSPFGAMTIQPKLTASM
jgi:hypothetical protein